MSLLWNAIVDAPEPDSLTAAYDRLEGLPPDPRTALVDAIRAAYEAGNRPEQRRLETEYVCRFGAESLPVFVTTGDVSRWNLENAFDRCCWQAWAGFVWLVKGAAVVFAVWGLMWAWLWLGGAR